MTLMEISLLFGGFSRGGFQDQRLLLASSVYLGLYWLNSAFFFAVCGLEQRKIFDLANKMVQGNCPLAKRMCTNRKNMIE
jgi:hypothetical protein